MSRQNLLEHGEQDKTLEHYISLLPVLSQSTHDYMFVWDIAHGHIYFDSEILKKYDLPKDQDYYSIEDWTAIIYPPDRQLLDDDLKQILSGEKQEHYKEYRLVNRQGEKVWINCCGKVFPGDSGDPIMVGRVSEKALTCRPDPITGLLSYGQMHNDLRLAMESEQYGYLMILDIDNFKDINDKNGRHFGNHILKLMASLLEFHIKLPDQIYRLDGDKFAIQIIYKDRSQTEQIYQTLRYDIQEKCGCTISAGVVSFPFQNADTPQLYQYAEDALNNAKKRGKNRFCFFSIEDYQKHLLQLELEAELKECIEHDFRGFSIAYQPQIQVESHSVAGAEALMRWTSEKRGAVFPDVFIPILEQTGLILQAGDWILKNALSQCKQWREIVPDFRISINLSYNQLFTNEIVDSVLGYLEENDLPGEALVLELTESIQLQSYFNFNEIFYQLGIHGVQVSIDDFGTGYSSLGYLKHLSVDEIKIDRCFVQQIQSREYNYCLIKTIIELARTIDVQVCVEGVETPEEMAILAELNPELVQGYLFGRPMPAEVFQEQILSERANYKAVFDQISISVSENTPQDKTESESGFREIVEGLDEIVYISDLNSYKLYYLNRSARRLSGAEDYVGQLCYKVLQNRNEPCEFCTNQILRKKEFHVWEYYNKYLKRHFVLKDKLINWNGKTARLEIAIDTTHRRDVGVQTRKKLRIERILVESARQLMNVSELETAISESLRLLAKFYKADRAYIFEIDSINEICANTYEWCSEDIAPQRNALQYIPLSQMQQYLNLFKDRRTILIYNAERSSNEGFSEYLRLRNQKINCFIAVPFFENDHIVNFVGIDNPSFKYIDDCSLLDSTAYLLISEIRKRRMSEQLYRMSYYDALTGIYNRNRYLADVQTLSEQTSNSMGIVFVDINNLKKVNDEYGHEQGDRLICHVVEQLKNCFEETQLYRISGDEFVILCREISRQDFRKQTDQLILLFSDQDFRVSIGKAWLNSNMDIQNMIRRADKMMYNNKQNYYRSNLRAELGIEKIIELPKNS